MYCSILYIYIYICKLYIYNFYNIIYKLYIEPIFPHVQVLFSMNFSEAHPHKETQTNPSYAIVPTYCKREVSVNSYHSLEDWIKQFHCNMMNVIKCMSLLQKKKKYQTICYYLLFEILLRQ